MRKNVAILIFDEVEVLDFAGPFEVFAVADEIHDYDVFNVFTVALESKTIAAVNGLKVVPDFDFNTVPDIDILVIPGGNGTRELSKNTEYLQWIEYQLAQVQHTLTVCSGARFLARLGRLSEQPYCTHQQVYDHIQSIDASALPQKESRFHTSENVTTSGGISAGIDAAFCVVEMFSGGAVVEATSNYMEYWIRDENGEPRLSIKNPAI